MVERTYHVTPEVLGESRRRALFRILRSAGCFAILNFLVGLLWHGTDPFNVFSRLAGSTVTGVFVAVFFYFFFTKPNMYYDILVSEDSISAIYQFAEKSVRKGEVKTVRECHGDMSSFAGLRVSGFGRPGTIFRGFVFIPKNMTDYDCLRELAESWKQTPSGRFARCPEN